jgi:parallel beta helix pectate lyase-like protein
MVQIVSTTLRVAIAALCCSGMAIPAAKTFDVNCGSKDTIAGALEQAEPGDTIRISGVCTEKIAIRTDGVTLAGVGGAIIRGGSVPQGVELDGLVTIDGARGVAIRNLTIERSRAEGILATRGAVFTIESVIVQDNGGAGLGAASSVIDIGDLTSRRNVAGFDLFNGTNVVLRGKVIASDNQNAGIFLGGASTLEVRGATVEANNNSSGVVALGGSQVSFWTFGGPLTAGGSISTSANRVGGVRLIDSGMEIFSDSAIIRSTGNPTGLILNGGVLSSGSPAQGVRVVLEENGVGLDVQARSIAVVIGGLSVRGNTTTGIVADDSSLILVSTPPNPSVVSSNVLDLDARFGSRLTVGGVAFATKKCEPTVLARGVPTCP